MLEGVWGEAMRQIGNQAGHCPRHAVPVRLGEVLGRRLFGLLAGKAEGKWMGEMVEV